MAAPSEFQRQFTSLTDQTVTRQPTSPFDIADDGTIRDDSRIREKIRALGNGKVELGLGAVTVVFNAGEATSLLVSSGGIEGVVRVGERVEVVDWAQNTGVAINFNGKRCAAAGSIDKSTIDAKTAKNAQRFVQAVAKAADRPFPELVQILARCAENSPLASWRAHTLGHSLISPDFAFIRPPPI